MKLFKRIIEAKAKMMNADDRILFLANRLYDEIEKSGRCLSTAYNLGYVTIWHHDSDSFIVENTIAKDGNWRVKGKRN